jgi:hypothetical protein
MRKYPEEASRRFERYQFVLNIMQLHQTWPHGAIFEVQRGRFKEIGTEIFPRIRFREDGVAKRTRAITAFLRIANLED